MCYEWRKKRSHAPPSPGHQRAREKGGDCMEAHSGEIITGVRIKILG